MSTTPDEITDGTRCMACLCLLVSDAGEANRDGHPVLCRDCFRELPIKQQRTRRQYYDRKAGRVVTY